MYINLTSLPLQNPWRPSECEHSNFKLSYSWITNPWQYNRIVNTNWQWSFKNIEGVGWSHSWTLIYKITRLEDDVLPLDGPLLIDFLQCYINISYQASTFHSHLHKHRNQCLGETCAGKSTRLKINKDMCLASCWYTSSNNQLFFLQKLSEVLEVTYLPSIYLQFVAHHKLLLNPLRDSMSAYIWEKPRY